MKTIQFEIPGDPKSLARHKTRIVRTKTNKVFPHEYDPPENTANKACIRHEALLAMQAGGHTALWLGPLKLDIMFWKLQPEGKRVKNPGRLSEESLLARSFPVTKPDIDNMVKLVCDALNGVVWLDDTQVCSLAVHKRYCIDRPRSIVTIRDLEIEECGAPLRKVAQFGVQDLPFNAEANK